MSGQRDMTAEYLFKKLTPFKDDDGKVWLVPELMERYMQKERESGHAWFSMPSHISESKAKEYNGKIQNGRRVRVLFGLNDENVDNDIGYSADVLEIYSSQEFVSCPEENGNLAAFPDETNKTWIKIRNIGKETAIRANMMKFTRKTSKSANLKEAICGSQCHFGYVSFR